MFIVRDIFQLKFGHYKPAKALLDEAMKSGVMPEQKGNRILSDFTGTAYRLVFEQSFDSLADFEKSMAENMPKPDWQEWYGKFKEHVEGSSREILKLVM